MPSTHNFLEGKRILITGGAGFLGSNLVSQLLCRDITVIDDFSTTKTNSLPKSVKLKKIKAEDLKTNEKYDMILHMAARPSPDDYLQHPVETMATNSLGTYNMLELARKNDSLFFFTSTSEVYGSSEVIPTPESYWGRVNPIGLRSCYDESKRYSEALALSYKRQYNLDIRIQRIFNTYGPRLRPDGTYGRVIARFILQALSGEDITIQGSGMQTRSFLYVDDWVNATLKHLSKGDLSGEIINIGSDKEVSILDLARVILSLANSKSKITHVPAREDDPPRRAADITKAKKILGWSPEIPLEEGLKRTIAWLRGVK